MGIKDDPLYKEYISKGKVYTYKEIREIIDSGKKPLLFYHIPRQEIEEMDFSNIDKLMSTIQNVGRDCCQSLILTVDGYDDTTEELFEIKEVVGFVNVLFAKHPNILYYISTFGEAEGWLINCYADSLDAVRSVDSRMTGDEMYERYGLDYRSAPTIKVKITIGADKVDNILKGIVRHSKSKKGAMRGKRIALYYMFKYFSLNGNSDIEEMLKTIKVKPHEVQDYIGGMLE